MNALKNIFAAIAVLAVGLLAGWCSRGRFAPEEVVTTQMDTLTIRDTFTVEKPVYLTSRITDTIRIVYPKDTIMVHDTLIMYREQRFYDHEKYQAWVSGIDPSLDSIRVFPETKYVTRTETISVKPRKRWGIGIQAGYGVSIGGGRVVTSPYIGVGVSYNLIRF